MRDEDLKRYRKNYSWFKEFFEGLESLFTQIEKALKVFSLHERNYYATHGRVVPLLPSYYGMGFELEKFAIMVLAILDDEILKNQETFSREPSLVIVRHSQKDKYGYWEDYCVRIVRNERIEWAKTGDSKIFGGKLADEEVEFYIFQVLLDSFASIGDTEETIQKEIIEPLRELPGW